MSLNIVRKGPEAAAGSNFNLYKTSGAAAPMKEVAVIADIIDTKMANANFINSGSFMLITPPIMAATTPHITPRKKPSLISEKIN